MPFESSVELFYYVLSVFFGCMTVLVSILLVKVIGILRDVQLITTYVKDTTKLINDYAWKPLEIFMHLKDIISDHLLDTKKKK